MATVNDPITEDCIIMIMTIANGANGQHQAGRSYTIARSGNCLMPDMGPGEPSGFGNAMSSDRNIRVDITSYPCSHHTRQWSLDILMFQILEPTPSIFALEKGYNDIHFVSWPPAFDSIHGPNGAPQPWCQTWNSNPDVADSGVGGDHLMRSMHRAIQADESIMLSLLASMGVEGSGSSPRVLDMILKRDAKKSIGVDVYVVRVEGSGSGALHVMKDNAKKSIGVDVCMVRGLSETFEVL
ncbi:hypothetical protein DFH94DRAFT_685511 [Russula ochroleuca]|uniref:Uncharacterized protein n=1 Tax=Russula ochroleuca TaxID=152965 RepID=A0A9P5JWS7_9AGAM|nr:hypothetical protein DFH94DRAFT_685511 [Russula ochroleuca]